MSWAGGTFTRVRNWAQDKLNAINPQASLFDQEDDNLAAGINQCMNKDGSNTVTGNLNIGGFRLTATGDATAATDALNRQTGDGRYPHVLSTVGGTADVITLTPTPASTAYAAGDTYRFVATGTNTTVVTLNVSGLGATSLTKNGTNLLSAGDIQSGALIEATYDGTRFQLKGSPGVVSSGSFTGTLTGMSGATTGTVKYKISGGFCVLYVDAAISGTSNSGAMTMTGLPAAVLPSISSGRHAYCLVQNNSVQQPGTGLIDPVTPKITFQAFSGVSGANVFEGVFVSSGSKGLPVTWTFMYPV